MSRRRRLNPPLIPGLWSLVAFLLLLGSVVGYYYVLAKGTRFSHVEEKARKEK